MKNITAIVFFSFVFLVMILSFSFSIVHSATPIATLVFKYVHITNITLYTFKVEQGVPFSIPAIFTIENATYPVGIYLVVDNYIWSPKPIIDNSPFVDVLFVINLSLTPANYTYYFIVTDANNYSAISPSATFTVVPHLQATMNISGSKLFETGQNVTAQLDIRYGIPPYHVDWFINGTPQNINTTKLNIKLTKQGTLNLTAVVYDAGSAVDVVTKILKVNSGIDMNIGNIPQSVDLGVPIYPNVSIYGGIPPYTVNYYVNGKKVGLPIVFNQTGVANLTIVAKDSYNGSYIKSYQINVVLPPTVFITYTMSSSLIFKDNCFYLQARPDNGIPPYHVYWFLNGAYIGSGMTTKACTLKFGTNNLTAVVYDADNVSGYHIVLINVGVNAVLIAIIVAIIAIVALIFYFANRARITYGY